MPPHLKIPSILTSRSRAPKVDVSASVSQQTSDEIHVEEVNLTVEDAQDVQVVSDSANDENTDGMPEDLNVPDIKTDDGQPVDLSVAHVKECKDENLCPVVFSFRNVYVINQVVSADDTMRDPWEHCVQECR